jgi:hypothetical protein
MIHASVQLVERGRFSRIPPEDSKIMGIANELSSDVVAAVLARKSDGGQVGTRELLEIVRNFHSALRDLTDEERRRRVLQPLDSASSQAASGGH